MSLLLIASIAAGLASQSAYLFLLNWHFLSTSIAVSAAVFGTVSLVTVCRRRHWGFISANRPGIVGLYVCTVYLLFLLLRYNRDDFSQLIDTFSCVYLLALVFCAAEAVQDQLSVLIGATIALSSAVALVHLISAGLTIPTVERLLSEDAARYGYFEGINLVNVTGANLSLLAAAGYVLARRADLRWAWRGLAAVAALSAGIATLATASRAAALTLAMVVCVTELASIQSGKRKLFFLSALVLGVALWLAALGGSQFQDIYRFAFERFASLSPDDTRLNGIGAALSLGGTDLLFGVAENSNVYLGYSPDNTLSGMLLSSGLVGLCLLCITSAFLIVRSGRALSLGPLGICLLMLPLAARAASEGAFLTQSILFPYACFACAVIAAERRSGRQPDKGTLRFRAATAAARRELPVGFGEASTRAAIRARARIDGLRTPLD